MIFHVEVTVEERATASRRRRSADAERLLELRDRRGRVSYSGGTRPARRDGGCRRRRGRVRGERGDGAYEGAEDRAGRSCRRRSSSAGSTRPSSSAATTPAGAGPARSSRSATAPDVAAERGRRAQPCWRVATRGPAPITNLTRRCVRLAKRIVGPGRGSAWRAGRCARRRRRRPRGQRVRGSRRSCTGSRALVHEHRAPRSRSRLPATRRPSALLTAGRRPRR